MHDFELNFKFFFSDCQINLKSRFLFFLMHREKFLELTVIPM